MIITEFERESTYQRQQLAELLAENWPAEYGADSLEEVASLLTTDRIAVAALDGEELLGFVGAIPQYGKTGWELHPLVVKNDHRRQKIGARLMDYVEQEVAAQGGIVLYLGADDERHQTSLSEGDLFVDTFEKIATIKNYDHHPYEFYQKQGYQIVGVIPDANGWNKPDIWLAKRIASE